MKELTLRHFIGPVPYTTNSFMICEKDGAAVIIDPVATMKQYQEELTEQNTTLKYIFLTHGHDDHTNTLKELRQKTGAKVCGFAIDGELYNYVVDIPLADEQMIALSEDTAEQFKVVHTPGHTPGSCCFLFEDLFFTGDTLFPGTVGRVDMENGDEAVMKETMKKLYAFTPDDLEIFPGHGAFTTMQIEKERNLFLRGDV